MEQIIRNFCGYGYEIRDEIREYINSGYRVVSMVSPSEDHVIVVFEKEDKDEVKD